MQVMDQFEAQSFKRGATIFKEGEQGDTFYIIKVRFT